MFGAHGNLLFEVSGCLLFFLNVAAILPDFYDILKIQILLKITFGCINHGETTECRECRKNHFNQRII